MAKEPDDDDEAKGRAGSLVERAARKIVVDRVRVERDDAEPAEAFRRSRLEDLPQQAVERGSVDDVLHQRPIPNGGDQASAEVRRSRLVEIDAAKLAAQNLLTPQTKRNRTVEEFRLIKRRVLARRWSDGSAFGNTVMVTSALPEEGKTTMSINLAMSIAAEEDLRVLLVDADFIKPDALRRLGVTADRGLIDVIENPRMDIADVMLRTDIDKLSLIPSGKPHERCTELLASARMNELIAELANRYHDRILIFDSPPVLATSESVALASHMGQIVFVVQAERTRRQLVDNALELLNRDNIGLVLNRAKPRIGSAEFGYYYSAYQHYQNGEQKSNGAEKGA